MIGRRVRVTTRAGGFTRVAEGMVVSYAGLEGGALVSLSDGKTFALLFDRGDEVVAIGDPA